MVALLIFGVFAVSLFMAVRTLVRLYRSHFTVGSEPWNDYQIALRDDLAAFSPRTASASEVRAFGAKEQAYVRRLELQLEAGVFTDEVERRRAERLGQTRRLEAARVYDALRQDR